MISKHTFLLSSQFEEFQINCQVKTLNKENYLIFLHINKRNIENWKSSWFIDFHHQVARFVLHFHPQDIYSQQLPYLSFYVLLRNKKGPLCRILLWTTHYHIRKYPTQIWFVANLSHIYYQIQYEHIYCDDHVLKKISLIKNEAELIFENIFYRLILC